MPHMDYSIYNNSLATALTLMTFFAFYFLVAKTPDKSIFASYTRSRRLMGLALLVLAANYSVHLFAKPRLYYPDSAILLNLATYFLAYWLFSSAFITLLDRFYLTRKRFTMHILLWVAYATISFSVLTIFPHGTCRNFGLILLPIWLLAYGMYLSYKIITTYRMAVRLIDDTNSEPTAAYIRWMSTITWWAVIYGVSCGIWTFLPDEYVYLWILSSIPFYIYIYCSYMNYLLFYEQVQSILEVTAPSELAATANSNSERQGDLPAYYTTIANKLEKWIEQDGYRSPGLNIEELSMTIGTNRTYLSSYINQTFHMSFREWVAYHRIEYAKKLLVKKPDMTVAEVSEASGFLSLSYFTKVFKENALASPSKWHKKHTDAE